MSNTVFEQFGNVVGGPPQAGLNDSTNIIEASPKLSIGVQRY